MLSVPAFAGNRTAVPSHVSGTAAVKDTVVSAVNDTAAKDTAALYVANDTSAVASAVSKKGLNALDYSMMKRWRPKNEIQFSSHRFFDNSFASVSGSGYRIFNRNYCSGPNLTLHFGKWLNAFHAVRISAGAGYYFDNFDGLRVKHIDTKASYLFNFSSYIGGYRPSRLCEISGVAGIGYSYLWKIGYSGHAFTAHIGANFNLHVLKNIDIFVEPLFEAVTDGLATPNVNNWRRYFVAFNGTLGMSCRFDPAGFPDILPDGRYFVYASGGIQIQNSALVLGDIDSDKMTGMTVSAGFGRRYGNAFAMRLSALYSKSNWIQTLQGDCRATEYVALRLEGMIDIVSLINGREHNVFCASLLFGPEAGYVAKRDIDRSIVAPTTGMKCGIPYVGLTGGVQAKFRISRSVAIFLEPRFSIVPYPAPTDNPSLPNANRNYYDGLLNCCIGVEYYL